MRPGQGFSEIAYVIWLAGAGCDGCTQAMLGAAEPSLEDLLAGQAPDAPRVVLLHPQLSSPFNPPFALEPNADKALKRPLPYEAVLRHAAAGGLSPYVLVLEGGVYDEAAAGAGGFSHYGVEPDGQSLTTQEWLRRLAPGAEAVIALGSCAAWGGIPAALGSSGVKGLAEFLGAEFRSRGGLPVINVPGCAPPGESLIETLIYTFLHLAQLVPIELDEAQRPRWLYSKTAYPMRPRTDYSAGSGRLLNRPRVMCPVPTLGWTRGLGGCTRIGGSCIACTEPDFADKYLGFARPDMSQGR
jgi:hydrogenase small subunit